MEASYLAGEVTRQRWDPGCYMYKKVLFPWQAVYMGEVVGNSFCQELGYKSQDLSWAWWKLSHVNTYWETWHAENKCIQDNWEHHLAPVYGNLYHLHAV